MALFNVEYTDTFGGEANYCWVNRKTVSLPDAGFYFNQAAEQREIMKAAKAAVGLTNVKGRTYWNGDSAEFRPYRMATVLFVNWTEEEYAFEKDEEKQED